VTVSFWQRSWREGFYLRSSVLPEDVKSKSHFDLLFKHLPTQLPRASILFYCKVETDLALFDDEWRFGAHGH
jgi:hypothetical protein